ncbi:MAG: hypothetical protein JW738_05310 [Actinobacteria bacterium]|nr:hypothetical protein [Actinomycetota bacterium]
MRPINIYINTHNRVYNIKMGNSIAFNKIKKASILFFPVLVVIILITCCSTPAECNNRSINTTSDSVNRALSYLGGSQQADGGFAEPGGSSSELLTTWVIPAIVSAGQDPKLWKKGGRSPIDFLASQAGSWQKLTDVERACFALASAGVDPRSFQGRNLVAEINANVFPDGRIGNSVNEHVWGTIALSSAAERLPSNCVSWLSSVQNTDGGFSFAAGAASDPDDTGAALQALLAAGADPGSQTVDRALKYLVFCQGDDGGFKWKSEFSNSASTAWAVQGISAAGEDTDSGSWQKNGKTPVAFLLEMQQPDGHIRYTNSSDAKPVWMTAEAVPALLKRPYPLCFTPKSKTTDDGTKTASTASTNSTADSKSTSNSTSAAEIDSSSENMSSASSESTSNSGSSNTPARSGSGTYDDMTLSSAGNGSTVFPSGQKDNSLNLSAFIALAGAYIAALILSFLTAHLYRNNKRAAGN